MRQSRFSPQRRYERIREAFRHGLKGMSEDERVRHSIFRDDLDWYYGQGAGRLRIVPLELREANALVESLHRHHKPVQGHRFSIGVVTEDGKLVGAATVGRPVARKTNSKEVLEVTRCVTDGTANACSALYAAAARVGKELGYKRIQTFVLASEDGASLEGANYTREGSSPGGSWSVASRPRTDKHPLEPKTRYAKTL